ncbi:MAG: hypothetical protein QGH01_10165 [Alphaproteobacteria bacterium]|nr:hypothetical protein [Alphaproteobacteria bacterium]
MRQHEKALAALLLGLLALPAAGAELQLKQESAPLPFAVAGLESDLDGLATGAPAGPGCVSTREKSPSKARTSPAPQRPGAPACCPRAASARARAASARPG